MRVPVSLMHCGSFADATLLPAGWLAQAPKPAAKANARLARMAMDLSMSRLPWFKGHGPQRAWIILPGLTHCAAGRFHPGTRRRQLVAKARGRVQLAAYQRA